MTRCNLPVAHSLIPLPRLPAGFEVVWERPTGGVILLTIDGPFPAEIKDGDTVGAVVSLDGATLFWRWLQPDGSPAGSVIEVGPC
jgi:hypothetical protein